MSQGISVLRIGSTEAVLSRMWHSSNRYVTTLRSA
jgi:hypothetical protein